MGLLRAVASRAVDFSGINFLVHKANAGKLVVLCYHGVVENLLDREHPKYDTTVTAAEFASHLELLTKWFHPVSLLDVRTSYLENKPLPRRAALVTFDDGYRNVLTHGAPILRRFGVPAAVFVSTSFIGGRLLFWYDEMLERFSLWKEQQVKMPKDGSLVPWPDDPSQRVALARRIQQSCKRVPNQQRLDYIDYVRTHTPPDLKLSAVQHHHLDPLNWDEVRSLPPMGIEIGSHTITHPILTSLTPAELKAELTESKAEIERQKCGEAFSIAFPNGTRADYSQAVLDATKAAGYDLAFTLVEQLNQPSNSPYLISRISIPGHVPITAFRVRVSGLYPILTGTASQPIGPA